MPPLLYTALGNCLAAGAGGPLLITVGYPRIFRRHLSRHLDRPVRLRNYGHLFGQTVAELIAALAEHPRLRRDLGQSQIVTLNIGENELLRAGDAEDGGQEGALAAALRRFRRDYPRAIDAILALIPPRGTLLRVCNIYLHDPAHPQAAYVDRFNRVIARHTAEGHNARGRAIPLADVRRAFQEGDLPRLLGFDGMHPSGAGHRLIANTLLALGAAPP